MFHELRRVFKKVIMSTYKEMKIIKILSGNRKLVYYRQENPTN